MIVKSQVRHNTLHIGFDVAKGNCVRLRGQKAAAALTGFGSAAGLCQKNDLGVLSQQHAINFAFHRERQILFYMRPVFYDCWLVVGQDQSLEILLGLPLVTPRNIQLNRLNVCPSLLPGTLSYPNTNTTTCHLPQRPSLAPVVWSRCRRRKCAASAAPAATPSARNTHP